MVQSIKLVAKNNKSFYYYFSFILIIIAYLMFFNARSFLPDDTTIFNTDLNKDITLGSAKLSITRWEYNQDKNFMEVELAYADSSDSMSTKFDFSAKARSNLNQKLDVKTMVSTDNICIVHMENIPKNYEAIALKVSQSSNNNLDADINTDDINFDSSSSNSD